MKAPAVRSVQRLVLAAALACAPAAAAQTQPAIQATDAGRDQARQLALEGLAAHQRADWAAVIDRFERAERLYHAPVHMKYLAIAYERATPARMVDAIEMWQRLSREQLPADAPEVSRSAVAEAQRELARLDSRIGHVVVEIPLSTQGASVELDGQPYPASSFNTPRFVDAGAHQLVARVPGRPPFERSFSVGPGATERIEVPVVVEQVARVEAPVTRTTTMMRANPLRMVGIVTAGVGVAAVVGGAIAGAMASSSFNQLETDCPMRRCATQQQLDQRGSVDTLAGASTGLFVAGGVLVAAGAVLFFVGRPREETIQVGIGPRAVSLSLRF